MCLSLWVVNQESSIICLQLNRGKPVMHVMIVWPKHHLSFISVCHYLEKKFTYLGYQTMWSLRIVSVFYCCIKNCQNISDVKQYIILSTYWNNNFIYGYCLLLSMVPWVDWAQLAIFFSGSLMQLGLESSDKLTGAKNKDGSPTWLAVDSVSWELCWSCQPAHYNGLSMWLGLLIVW